ncbi:DUF3450 domain-containing protein [Ferrimonas balearica]|uniref:DUF3450 family protein n=1 Tax=Ferrimonas balearica TaxID=44012 RepID=UPI001C59E458|nr:DUF3450 family protein [Ferrimonas balearica]MBW3138118.1 DUF3450 domain-containing protein [Ferrimonas balearica]
MANPPFSLATALLSLSLLSLSPQSAAQAVPPLLLPLAEPVQQAAELGQQALNLSQEADQQRSDAQQQLAELAQLEFAIAREQHYLAELQRQQQAQQQQLQQLTEIDEALAMQMEVWYARLERHLYQDLPFDPDARHRRLTQLRQVMDQPDLAIAERFARLHEALFIELKLGSDLTLSEQVLPLAGTPMAVTTVRLGRMGWYALSQDGQQGYRYGADCQRWLPLAPAERAELQRGIAMLDQQALPEWITLPLSRTAQEASQ